MTRDELEHAIRAACEVAGDTEVWVFGSQAILATFPHAPASLRVSREVDVAPKNFPERADLIDGALGELSRFDRTHGFYVHGLTMEGAALPAGWRERTVTVRNPNTRMMAGHCLEAHDLAASKLAAFRDKDREFVRTLLVEAMIEPAMLRERLRSLELSEDMRSRLVKWVDATTDELRS